MAPNVPALLEAHYAVPALGAVLNALAFKLAPDSVYLWTLPMFHCSGWTYTWAVTAAGGTHVCLRRVDPALIFAAIRDHRVTHLCAAPIVLNMLIHAPEEAKLRFDHIVDVATGGAAPPSAVIEAMEALGFRVTHLYQLTESYGPAPLCVWHPDNYIEIKDRSKDIILSGGENISSLEVEECLYRHPHVMEAAVVARPDAKWGETPCAFVVLKPGAPEVDAGEIIAWCRDHI